MWAQDQLCDKSLPGAGIKAECLLADIQGLAPSIASRAGEIEAGRRMPPDLVETLVSVGAFRLFAPQTYDGLELDLPTALKIISAIARIEGSVGWTVMIGNGGHLFAPVLPARGLWPGHPPEQRRRLDQSQRPQAWCWPQHRQALDAWRRTGSLPPTPEHP